MFATLSTISSAFASTFPSLYTLNVYSTVSPFFTVTGFWSLSTPNVYVASAVSDAFSLFSSASTFVILKFLFSPLAISFVLFASSFNPDTYFFNAKSYSLFFKYPMLNHRLFLYLE